MAKEEKMRKEALDVQMAKLNLDLYSFDLPPHEFKPGHGGAETGFYKAGVSGIKKLVST